MAKRTRGTAKSRPKKLPAGRMPKGLRAIRRKVQRVIDAQSGIAPGLGPTPPLGLGPESVASMRARLKEYDDARRERLGALPRPVSVFHPLNYTQTSTFERLVDEELQRARAANGDQRNLHEGYAVILEEVDEFWDEVKTKQSTPGRAERALKELVQVAAMARRCAEDVLGVGFE